jgi:hypothetical protein
MRRDSVRTFAALLALAVVATLAGASVASARSGDSWLTTRTAAAHQLPTRFKDVASVSCAPDTTSASRVFGTTRYWQRFWCSGKTYDHLSFHLRYRVLGQCGACWTITDLKGVGADRLRARHTATTSATTTTASCGADYYRNVDGQCVHRPTTDPNAAPGGATALCVDGTYSYSQHASGTCSHHGGVARWIHHP